MRKIFTLCLLLSSLAVCRAQEFSFNMKFTDAAGHHDSLTLGYDPAATDSLDAMFGEVNILSTPYAAGLDVRTSNHWYPVPPYYLYGLTPYESKTQIVPKSCGSANFWVLHPIIEVNIVCSHFPVTAYWDKDLFNTICGNGSLFTDWNPVNWWDVGPGAFVKGMREYDSVSFDRSPYYYPDGIDTVFVYWVALHDSTLIGLGIEEAGPNHEKVSVFPNPAYDCVSVNVSPAFGEIETIQVFNTLGQNVLSTRLRENIPITDFPGGLYFIQMESKCGKIVSVKFLKN